jgi:hypothetical protein
MAATSTHKLKNILNNNLKENFNIKNDIKNISNNSFLFINLSKYFKLKINISDYLLKLTQNKLLKIDKTKILKMFEDKIMSSKIINKIKKTKLNKILIYTYSLENIKYNKINTKYKLVYMYYNINNENLNNNYNDFFLLIDEDKKKIFSIKYNKYKILQILKIKNKINII